MYSRDTGRGNSREGGGDRQLQREPPALELPGGRRLARLRQRRLQRVRFLRPRPVGPSARVAAPPPARMANDPCPLAQSPPPPPPPPPPSY